MKDLVWCSVPQAGVLKSQDPSSLQVSVGLPLMENPAGHAIKARVTSPSVVMVRLPIATWGSVAHTTEVIKCLFYCR